jgi:hypothetical protein
MDSEDDLNPNPIVAMAMRIRARKDVDAAVDAAIPQDAGSAPVNEDVIASLEAFTVALRTGTTRLNTVLGKPGVTFVRLEHPLRVRLRFGDKRVSLDIDNGRQLVIVRGLGLDGEYQFDPGADVPALINLSKLSTEQGYGEALTPSRLLKTIAADAELPRPPHLDALGPIQPS